MVNYFVRAAALTAAVVVVCPALAATVTKTFTFTATGLDPTFVPSGQVSGTFSATIDTSASTFQKKVDSFFSDLPFGTFDATNVVFSYNTFAGTNRFTVGSNLLAGVITPGVNDFDLSFRTDNFIGNQFAVTRAGVAESSFASGVIVSEVSSAVPEPATWAMLLVGFGGIGAASRYRRRSTSTTFA